MKKKAENMLFTRKFIKDLAERVLATFAQSYIAAVVVLPGALIDIEALKIAIGAAILSLFTGVAASKIGEEDSASLVDDE